MTNNENIQNVESNNIAKKFEITPAQKRQVQIRISDLLSTYDMYNDENVHEYYEKIGHLTAMSMGVIPFEKFEEFSSLPISEKKSSETITAFFFANASQLRESKLALMRGLQLLHQPHAMTVKGQPGVRRFRVNDVTREAADAIMNRNSNIFTHYATAIEDREKSGIQEKVEDVIKVESDDIFEDEDENEE